MKRNESDALKYPFDFIGWVGKWNHGGKNFISDSFLQELIEESDYIENQTVTAYPGVVVFQWHDRYGQPTDSITYTRVGE